MQIRPHRSRSPDHSHTYLSAPSRSKRGIVLSVKVSQSVWLANAAFRRSLKSVRSKESLRSSSSTVDTTVKCFASQNPKKASVPGSVANTCRPSEKATASGFAVSARTPSAVNVWASSGSCHQIAAIVCRCAWLCSASHHFTRLLAISARADNTFHLLRSWALVQLRP